MVEDGRVRAAHDKDANAAVVEAAHPVVHWTTRDPEKMIERGETEAKEAWKKMDSERPWRDVREHLVNYDQTLQFGRVLYLTEVVFDFLYGVWKHFYASVKRFDPRDILDELLIEFILFLQFW